MKLTTILTTTVALALSLGAATGCDKSEEKKDDAKTDEKAAEKQAAPAKDPAELLKETKTPELPGPLAKLSFGMSAVARRLTSSAMRMYCSTNSSLVVRAAAWLLKPCTSSSGGNPLAGAVVSPSRSRTVLLYSKRVRRRMGVSTTQSELCEVPG